MMHPVDPRFLGCSSQHRIFIQFASIQSKTVQVLELFPACTVNSGVFKYVQAAHGCAKNTFEKA